jgi:deazaflavin-dependent oxidoreductase (nitroreductase family)
MTTDPNFYTRFNDSIIEEFRRSGGTVARFGRGLVLLHHLGAKSGIERVTPAMSMRDGDAWLIAASKAGADENPAWYHNLLTHPDIQIETADAGVVAVHVTELKNGERDQAWSRFTTMSSGFRSYEQRTTRVIPVLRLTPRS